jgi:hypothetical protein
LEDDASNEVRDRHTLRIACRTARVMAGWPMPMLAKPNEMIIDQHGTCNFFCVKKKKKKKVALSAYCTAMDLLHRVNELANGVDESTCLCRGRDVPRVGAPRLDPRLLRWRRHRGSKISREDKVGNVCCPKCNFCYETSGTPFEPGDGLVAAGCTAAKESCRQLAD